MALPQRAETCGAQRAPGEEHAQGSAPVQTLASAPVFALVRGLISRADLIEGRPGDISRRWATLLLAYLIDDLVGEEDRTLTTKSVQVVLGDLFQLLDLKADSVHGVLREFGKLCWSKGKPKKQMERWRKPSGKIVRERVFTIPKALPSL